MATMKDANRMDPTSSWLIGPPRYYCTFPVSATITAFVLENATLNDNEALPKHLRTYLPGPQWLATNLHQLPKSALNSKSLVVFTVCGAERLSGHYHLRNLGWVCRTAPETLEPRAVPAPPRSGIRWLCCGRT